MPKRTAAAGSKPSASSRPKKTATGYKFPEHIPSGFIIKDTKKQEWCIHDTIGTGGFGEIYSASDAKQTSKLNSTYPYAVKVEPKENGPLYVEMHFYMRVAKAEDIEEWKKKKKFKTFGMPVLRGSGSFEYKSNNYRFLVTDKLGRNLQDILNENGKCFPRVTTLQIGVQVLNILEYIHSKGYIHGDIKAANMMLGLHPGTENTIYVIDFGLAAKCSASTVEYKTDPKKAQNGTIEYISRDGHIGVFGFRGDLEILGYNLLHWINGSLPWEKDIANAAIVEKKKNELMKDPAKFIKSHLPKVSEELIEYMKYIGSLKNNDVPDYEYCKKLFVNELTKLKCPSPYGKLIFNDNKIGNLSSPVSKKKTTPKVKQVNKKVNSKSSPAIPLVVPAAVKNTRKRKSPLLKDTSKEDVKEEEPQEVLQRKKPRKKNINFEPQSLSSNGNIEEVNGESNNLSSNSDSEIEASTNRKKKLSRRSSVKFVVRKKSPQIKGRKKNMKPTENINSGRREKDLNSSGGESTASTSQSEQNGNSRVDVLKRKRNKKLTNDENKPSWRDAPTVVASRVKVAGEYVKNSSSAASKTRKKT